MGWAPKLDPMGNTDIATGVAADPFATSIRRHVIEQSMRAKVGHIGSALSIADIIAALYDRVMDIESPEAADRDRLVLSKGHAVLAVYAALHLKGWMSAEQLNTFCGDRSSLGVHPEHQLRGIDFSSGSLGQGMSVGAGAALAARLQKSARRVFVVLSDAECDEGSVWEAMAFAAHHKLSNLVAILDLNGQQAFGFTKDVIAMENMAERWTAFGWHAVEIDGHDPAAMAAAIADHRTSGIAKPLGLIARTVFGCGVDYMENTIKWHYSPMDESHFASAMAQIGGAR